MKSKTALFLGAGFSKSAGLPLVNELFNGLPLNPGKNKTRQKIYEKVLVAWGKSGFRNPEQWLRNIYLKELKGKTSDISFEDIKDFILARIVMLPEKYGTNGPYYYGISTSILSKEHQLFWGKINALYDIRSIITTNYDIIIEQGYRNSYSTSSNHRRAPDLKYGGFPNSFKQYIRIMTQIGKGKEPSKYREEELKGIELFKIHGSVNWVKEPHGLKIHDDVRAVYRIKRSLGKPFIIPPLREKEKPDWAYMIWEYALKRLSEVDTWFVCGYSMPDYDLSVINLFKEASRGIESLNLIIADPNAQNILNKFLSFLEVRNINPTCLPGLPQLNYVIK